jgi:hypothetical protein
LPATAKALAARAGGFPGGHHRRRLCSLADTLRRNRTPSSVPIRLRYPASRFVLIELHFRQFGSRIALYSV